LQLWFFFKATPGCVFGEAVFRDEEQSKASGGNLFAEKLKRRSAEFIPRVTAIATATRGIYSALRQSAFSGFPQRQQ
jgi:hypothetical protein